MINEEYLKGHVLDILFENEDLVAVNKPDGIASITENDTKLESVHSLLENKTSQKLFIVHRLDKEVSGVILFAKNSKTHKHLNQQFNIRKIKKFYYALIHGVLNKNDGVISKPIRKFGSGRMGVDERKGKQSETKYHVIERFRRYTLLELSPSTGRRHQLRVHLYSMGNPIVGDVRYGDKTVQKSFPRIMLHATRIEFELRKGKSVSIEAPLPDSFQRFLTTIA